jgi:hypothetical protein
MSYSSSSSHTYFTAGEPAPTCAEALNGSIIPNDGGWMGVVLDINTPASDSFLQLDETTEPPTLRLKNVGARALWGEIVNGSFVHSEDRSDAGYIVLTGDYSGAESKLIAE